MLEGMHSHRFAEDPKQAAKKAIANQSTVLVTLFGVERERQSVRGIHPKSIVDNNKHAAAIAAAFNCIQEPSNGQDICTFCTVDITILPLP